MPDLRLVEAVDYVAEKIAEKLRHPTMWDRPACPQCASTHVHEVRTYRGDGRYTTSLSCRDCGNREELHEHESA